MEIYYKDKHNKLLQSIFFFKWSPAHFTLHLLGILEGCDLKKNKLALEVEFLFPTVHTDSLITASGL